MKSETSSFPVNHIRVCIDNPSAFSGRIYGTSLKDPVDFTSEESFLRSVCSIYDGIGQPLSYTVVRSFGGDGPKYNSYKASPRRYYTAKEIEKLTAKCNYYDLIMLSRRNSEWQGLIQDNAGQFMGNFKTAFECLKLMHDRTHAEAS